MAATSGAAPEEPGPGGPAEGEAVSEEISEAASGPDGVAGSSPRIR